MDIYEGMLFHERYLIESLIGCGASAEVWKARDTRANNLVVALKIFTLHAEMDSFGLQVFEREFTTVYNMKHSNLLPPTGYDICEGCPYLIMQFCENGSCSSMAGRMEEEDIIKFLHDVAAGLECLHDHNIIHQDIKPDNILLDDNCNFLVTDFGISVKSKASAYDDEDTLGGTRSYMGPERFEGITESASDIWSLGATAFELLTGYPPFGEHGGILQAQGEALPDLPKLQPEVSAILLATLESDPHKRITAYEIRQKIELYWDTGAWVKHSRKSVIGMGIALGVSICMCIGIFWWNYNRLKVSYYKDYAEYWGVPKGICKLSGKEVAHRMHSYRFEYQKRKLRRVSLVNSAGNVVSHDLSEYMLSRHSDIRYFYTDDGKVDYTMIYDENGNVLYKIDFDENLKTATFRLNDDFGTEKNLDATINIVQQGDLSSIFKAKSRISRYLLNYNSEGLLKECRYAGLQNVLACDKDKIYGIRYNYDDEGRVVEEAFISADGKITSNGNGLSFKVFDYDVNDNLSTLTYYNAQHKASHNGKNVPKYVLEYDKYGNCLKELFYTVDGTPVLDPQEKIAGIVYTYDNRGFRVTATGLATDGSKAYNNERFVTVRDSIDDNGFLIQRDYLDENGLSVLCQVKNFEGDYFSSSKQENNEKGLPIRYYTYDENGEPLESQFGVFLTKCSYDNRSNIVEFKYFDKDEKPVLQDGLYHVLKMEHDEFNRLVRQYALNEKGGPAVLDGKVAEYRLEYNRQGAVTKFSTYDVDGNLVENSHYSASCTFEYDEFGNQHVIRYFNADGKPCMSSEGGAKIVFDFDPETNFCVSTRFYDEDENLLQKMCSRFDERGNLIEHYTLENGKLKENTAVEHYKMNNNNQQISIWYTDLKGKRVNRPMEKYCEAKFEYDENGNCIVITYWNTDGTPGVDLQKTHRSVKQYDVLNRVICEKNFDRNNKPLVGANVNPEGRVKYDKWGNMVELTCYDGYDNPCLSAGGFFKLCNQYDKKGNNIYSEVFGVDEMPICPSSLGYARCERKFNKYGSPVSEVYYNVTSCIREEQFIYNAQNKLIKRTVHDGNGNLYDGVYGFAKTLTEYEKSGVVPIKRSYYNQKDKLIATQKWNKKKGVWDEIHNLRNKGVLNEKWKELLLQQALQCPMTVEEGLDFLSIKVQDNSVQIVIKFTTFAKDDNEELDHETVAEACRQIISEFHKSIGIPQQVHIELIIYDRDNQRLDRI